MPPLSQFCDHLITVRKQLYGGTNHADSQSVATCIHVVDAVLDRLVDVLPVRVRMRDHVGNGTGPPESARDHVVDAAFEGPSVQAVAIVFI